MSILPDTWSDSFATAQLELVKGLVQDMPEAIMITEADDGNLDPPILHVNHSFCLMTGYEPEDVVGKTPKILQGPKTERDVLERLKEEMRANEKFRGKTWNYRKDGTAFLMEWEIVSFYDANEEKSFHMTIQRAVDS